MRTLSLSLIHFQQRQWLRSLLMVWSSFMGCHVQLLVTETPYLLAIFGRNSSSSQGQNSLSTSPTIRKPTAKPKWSISVLNNIFNALYTNGLNNRVSTYHGLNCDIIPHTMLPWKCLPSKPYMKGFLHWFQLNLLIAPLSMKLTLLCRLEINCYNSSRKTYMPPSIRWSNIRILKEENLTLLLEIMYFWSSTLIGNI